MTLDIPVIREPGLLYIYLSYENESSNPVFFDDLKVTYSKLHVAYGSGFPIEHGVGGVWVTMEVTTSGTYPNIQRPDNPYSVTTKRSFFIPAPTKDRERGRHNPNEGRNQRRTIPDQRQTVGEAQQGNGDDPWYHFFADGNPGGDFLYELNKFNPLAVVANSASVLITGKDLERGNPMSTADAAVNLASIIPIFKLGKVVNVLGSTGRIVAKNLAEQLAMQEIMSNPAMGRVIIPRISDPRWNGWSKMAWNNAGVEIHYVAKWENGILKVDDFKFK